MSKPENLPKSESMINSKNECIIEGELESLAYIYLTKGSILETAKIYGPIYTRMVSEHALEFESRMLKEEPPENVRGLEEVTNYIVANLNRYPRGHCSLVYGIGKAESKLQGYAGSSGSRRAAYGGIRNMLEAAGLLNSLIGATEDVLEANKAYDAKLKDAVAAKALSTIKAGQVQRVRYIRVEGKNEVNAVVSNCVYKETCLAFVDEGISRMVGGLQCIILMLGNAVTEIITRKHFDYALDQFDEPDCRGRIWEV
ncbi:MAG: hypothetical protein WED07_15030 [Candidatus Freyarchaeum deiterrae]